jgi:hypothetical protein
MPPAPRQPHLWVLEKDGQRAEAFVIDAPFGTVVEVEIDGVLAWSQLIPADDDPLSVARVAKWHHAALTARGWRTPGCRRFHIVKPPT